MKVFKYLIALWASIGVYSIFSLISGPAGLSAYQELLDTREKQRQNIAELRSINSELESAQNNLLYDPGTIAVFARELGYGHEDEQFMRIVGLGGMKNPYNLAGDIVIASEPVFFPEKIIKICALIAGFMVFALFITLDFFHYKNLPYQK
jgi:cell division protein FtsB